MISSTAGRCLGLIGALELVGHRKPADPVAAEEWDQTVHEISYKVMVMDEAGEQAALETLLAGLQDEWRCYLGETVAIKMGLATRGLLDGP